MIMKKLLYILLPVFISLVTLTSCDKQNEQDLIGEWELLSKPNENYSYKWIFNGSKVTLMATDVHEPYDGEFDTCVIGNYILKNGVLTVASANNYCSYMTYVGDWDIQKLDVEFLTMRHETNTGTLWYEFQKVK